MHSPPLLPFWILESIGSMIRAMLARPQKSHKRFDMLVRGLGTLHKGKVRCALTGGKPRCHANEIGTSLDMGTIFLSLSPSPQALHQLKVRIHVRWIRFIAAIKSGESLAPER